MIRASTRIILTFVFLAVAGQASAIPASAQSGLASGRYDREISVDGRDRTYTVHVPAGASAGLPLLIVLHGGGGNADHVERTTGFSKLADEAGFIVVYPNGSGRVERRLTWNAANCCAYAHEKDIDDVAFIDAMLDAIDGEFAPDMSRVYLTGHSNGAMMTYRLGCQLAERFAAIAPVAGALNETSCLPARPLPILIIHGENDENVRFDGGLSSGFGASGEDSRIDQPVSHAVDTWIAIDGCETPGVVTKTDSAVTTTYGSCQTGAPVELVVVRGWGHPWPGPNADQPAAIGALFLLRRCLGDSGRGPSRRHHAPR